MSAARARPAFALGPGHNVPMFGTNPAAFKGFQLKVDVFNAFNRQSIETIEERYNTPGGATTVWSRYGHVESYSAPRSVKLSASYDYKF